VLEAHGHGSGETLSRPEANSKVRSLMSLNLAPLIHKVAALTGLTFIRNPDPQLVFIFRSESLTGQARFFSQYSARIRTKDWIHTSHFGADDMSPDAQAGLIVEDYRIPIVRLIRCLWDIRDDAKRLPMNVRLLGYYVNLSIRQSMRNMHLITDLCIFVVFAVTYYRIRNYVLSVMTFTLLLD
jgi:hypothetical protein